MNGKAKIFIANVTDFSKCLLQLSTASPPPSADRDLKHFESLNESEVYNKKKFLVEMFLSILQAERNYL